MSALLTLAGSAFAVVVLAQLRESFSIMAEARRLVTAGVYRRVRHPLYLAEEIAAIGLVMQFFSAWTALILAVQIGFQLRRMRNEEAVLTENYLSIEPTAREPRGSCPVYIELPLRSAGPPSTMPPCWSKTPV